MAFDLSILAQPLAPKRNPDDFRYLTNTALNIGGLALQKRRDDNLAEQSDRRTAVVEEQNKRQAEAFKREIDRQGKTEAMKTYALTMSKVQAALNQGDLESARNMVADRQIGLIGEKKLDPSLDIRDTTNLLDLSFSDPVRFYATVNSEVAGLTRAEFIKPGPKSDVLSDAAFKQQLKLRGASKPETNITNTIEAEQAGMTQEQKALATGRVERFTAIQARALEAQEQNDGLDKLDKIQAEQGFGVQTRASMAAMFNSFGVDGNDLMGVDPANVQAYNAVGKKLVLDVMATQKGPQTKEDQAIIAQTIPRIETEEGANEFIKGSMKAINFRKIEMAEFYEIYLQEYRTLAGDRETGRLSADRAWAEYKRTTPLLSDNIQNPETGLPMFFHEFKAKLLERNPTATDQQAINAWRELAL